jgi:hypothetical protein
MPVTIGATSKREERKGGEAGEDQGRGVKGSFGHIYKYENTRRSYLFPWGEHPMTSALLFRVNLDP